MESSDTKFAEEVRKLNQSFQQLKSDLAITKNVNSQLHSHCVNLKRQRWILPSMRQCPVFSERMYGDCGYTYFNSGQ